MYRRNAAQLTQPTSGFGKNDSEYPEHQRTSSAGTNHLQLHVYHYQVKKVPSNLSACCRSSKNVLRARRRVIRMLTILVLAFAVCNLPFHARKMWQYWSSQYDGTSSFSSLFTPITFLCTYTNSLINPLLYAFLSKNFQKSIKEFLTCRWRGKSHSRQISFRQKCRRSVTRSLSNNEWQIIFHSRRANAFDPFRPSNSAKIFELSSEDYDEWNRLIFSFSRGGGGGGRGRKEKKGEWEIFTLHWDNYGSVSNLAKFIFLFLPWIKKKKQPTTGENN